MLCTLLEFLNCVTGTIQVTKTANTFLYGLILVSTAPEEKYMEKQNGRNVCEKRRARKERGH